MTKKPTHKEQLEALRVQIRIAPESIILSTTPTTLDRCRAKNKTGWRCSRPGKHDGPHLAVFGPRIAGASSICASNGIYPDDHPRWEYPDNPWMTRRKK